MMAMTVDVARANHETTHWSRTNLRILGGYWYRDKHFPIGCRSGSGHLTHAVEVRAGQIVNVQQEFDVLTRHQDDEDAHQLVHVKRHQ